MTPNAREESLERLAVQVARLARHVEEVRGAMDQELTGLRGEAERLLAEIQALNPAEIGRDTRDPGALLASQIPDDRLRRVWQTLFRYSDGATADEIAGDLERHRTTISTYLNMLVVMGFARKRRSGHTVYYTTIVKPDHAES